jgi:cell division protein FtsQ
MALRKTKEVRGREYGRSRGGPGCLSMFFLAVFVTASVVATIAIFFRINRIRIKGNERYTAEEIRVASGVETGDNLLIFNKFKATSNIFGKLPYIDEIRMLKDLPDTLVIEVRETRPVAYITGNGGFWLISPKGKLLEFLAAAPATDLIEVRGATPVSPEAGKPADFGPEDTARFNAMVDTLLTIDGEGIAADVDSLDVSRVYDIEIGYLGRFRVRLGMPENLSYKLRFLREKVVKELKPNDRGVIDLSELIEKKEGRFIPDRH